MNVEVEENLNIKAQISRKQRCILFVFLRQFDLKPKKFLLTSKPDRLTGDRLINLVQDYKNRDRLEYIKGISQNLCQITRQKKGHVSKRKRVAEADLE